MEIHNVFMPSSALSGMRKLSIVVPVYNEEKRIAGFLDLYLPFFRDICKQGTQFEIVTVINNSKDRSRKIIESYKAKEIKILEFKRGGKGFAVIEGFKDALSRDADVIGFVDADAATSPAAFYHLCMHLNNNAVDGVIASRYLPGAIISPAPTLKRRLFSRLYNAVLRSVLILPYRDTQCGAKVFSRKVIQSILPRLSMSQWAFDLELLYVANKHGFRIKEIPTVWADKEYSKVTSFFKTGFMMFLGVLRLRLLNSPFYGLVRVYDHGAGLVRKAIHK
jgi:glycosyltransferase involved in cell wall biosynthesis